MSLYACGIIPVGHSTDFKFVTALGKFGVYATNHGYVVARTPSQRVAAEFVPSSAIAAFSSAEEAIKALNKWNTGPRPVKPLHESDQLFLNLNL